MKTIVLIPSTKEVSKETLDAIKAEGDFEIIANILEPVELDANPARNKLLNIIRNRKELRTKALATDAEAFLWIDSDITIPRGTMGVFSRFDRDIMGAWYHRKDKSLIASKFVEDDISYGFQRIHSEIIEADHLGFGCCFMKRKVLEDVPFGNASWNYKLINGQSAPMCECMEFVNDAKQKGFKAYMVPIYCQHIIK